MTRLALRPESEMLHHPHLFDPEVRMMCTNEGESDNLQVILNKTLKITNIL